MTIGLYNSLDPVRFSEAHRRALARAGPVAEAFNCNLVVFGFPFSKEMRTPTEIATWLLTTTSIGQGGDWILKLARGNRFMSFEYPKKGFPPQLGGLIIGTRKPDENRAISPGEVAGSLKDGRSHLLLLGLGPKGLPAKIIDMGRYHMDLTGRGISFETCTAMGAAPAVIMTHLQLISDQ